MELVSSPQFAFLMDAYSFRHYYWESLDLVRKLLLIGLVLFVGRGSVAQNVTALTLSFGFFALQARTWPYKLLQDNLFRAATELHVFVVIAAGLALRSDLSGETLQEDGYGWILAVTFLVLVPGAFIVTVVSKVWSAKKSLSDTGTKGSFSRLRFGLANDADREAVHKHVQSIKASLDPDEQKRLGLKLHAAVESRSVQRLGSPRRRLWAATLKV